MPNDNNLKLFISKASDIHNNFYDYSKVEYKNNRTKVKIICPKHGEFIQQASVHLNGSGCKLCSYEKNSLKLRRNIEEWKKQSKIVHNNFYDYSKVEYKNNRTKVKIICPKHGIFEQTPDNHIHGVGCYYCGLEKISKIKNLLAKDTFIQKANLIHNNLYDYSQTEYISCRKKVKIICKIHGLFLQDPNNHLNGKGCPICNAPKGEILIAKILKEKNVYFEKQKSFENCKYKNFLYFDFYIPKYNIFIEFNGKQHYAYNKFFHKNQKTFLEQQKRFEIKKEYAKTKGTFIEIKYTDNIQNKLFCIKGDN